ncbi:helicase HerA domain-containing protein [Desulfurispora thermophila]|uniref:helicase HerA domain-containing protein n=1 Tax=Desulfurispora thermophila TaxID=265470 RepID=UPI00035CD057|nr:ATP-binding protein [Desulfurispora thermophila]
MKLFDKDNVVGIFRGFSEGGLEFHADLVLPYRNEFQNSPMHGQFILVQLETENEAVLGRVASISSEGRLISSDGEDFGIRAVLEGRPIPEDLREKYLKYRVSIRVLGLVRVTENHFVFAPSHRRLPHVGSKVAFPSDDVLKEIAGHNLEGAEIGHLAYGEFIFAGDDHRIALEPWMQVRYPKIVPRFNINNLVSRRTVVFARAGFGKSNLNKLLFAHLYKETPTVEKRGGKRTPVGTLIFDPDGEYFWPDDKNRPGLCDVPELEDKIVLFTNRRGPSEFYNSFIAGGIKLDIRRLRPAHVISIALSPEKQDQQNVRKLKQMNDADWARLVDEIYLNGNKADEELIRELLHLSNNQDAELAAARANVTTIVKMLHDPSSFMLDMLFRSLKAGKLCIVDLSGMRGQAGLILSGLIIQKIFDHNQEEFTKAESETIPVIAVVEEAQSVLGNGVSNSAEEAYVTWVKEGRKYDLGALLITQQPGSIPHELLSQADSWFVFHLLSAGDLQSLKKANAHYSDDILSSLLNEPIPGHCVFWSSVRGKTYPLPIRVMSFEKIYTARDPEYCLPPGNTYARMLQEEFSKAYTPIQLFQQDKEADDSGENENQVYVKVDPTSTWFNAAVEAVRNSQDFEKMKRNGVPWMAIQKIIQNCIPDTIADRERLAHSMVSSVLSYLCGNSGWDTEKRPKRYGGGVVTYIIKPY